MKKIFYAAIAVVMMGMTACQNGNGGQQTVTRTVVETGDGLPIAYINTDSLLVNYDLAKDLNEELMKKTENARANFNGKAQQFERDYAEFQRKLQTNAFLSQDRAQQEANNLQSKKDQLDQLNAKLQQDLAEEQLKMNARLSDSIRNFLQIYNAEKNYEMIISNTMNDNVLIAQPKYNITEEVTKMLNDRYAKTK